jgi:transposase
MLTKDMKASLPSDVVDLQAIVLELYEKVDEMSKNYERSEMENKLLRERIHQLQHQIYGRKSEKFSLSDGFEQNLLFEEPESSEESENNKSDDEEEITITVPEHKRKKGGRKPLPEEFPRVEVFHDLSDEEKMCNCGCQKSCIGEEVSEQLEMQPTQFRVIRHIRYKYACKSCEGVENAEGEGAVTIAPVPVQLIPKSIATPSLLSYIFVSKFCDALPFYRQEKLFDRIGFEISRATMCHWAVKVSDKCKDLLELLRRELLSGPLINIDETTLQVLHEPGRRFDSKSYMWVFRGGTPDKPLFVYIYAETRSGDVAANFLGAYQGYVQTDGYSGYDFLDRREGIIHLACWAHVRRKFKEVVQAGGQFGCNGDGLAREALDKIRQLYRIEREAVVNGLDADELYNERQKRSKPLLDKFKLWLNENAPKAPPKSLLGKAFSYTLSQWHRLIRYVLDGRLQPDNNLVENAVRPFVVGRKNWLFNDQPDGASASATFYSLIETAKANGLEPYKYLCYLFDRLPFAQSTEDLQKLLPPNLTPEFLEEHHSNMFRQVG